MMYNLSFKKMTLMTGFLVQGLTHTHTHTHHLINKIITQNGKQHIKLNVKFKILK